MKTLSEFNTKKDNADGYNTMCRECFKEYMRAYHEPRRRAAAEHRRYIKEVKEQRRAKCKAMFRAAKASYYMSPVYMKRKEQRIRDYNREYVRRNKDKAKAYKEKNKDVLRERRRAREQTPEGREKKREQRRMERQKPWNKTRNNLRKMIVKTLNKKSVVKNSKSLDILGCTWAEAINHVGEHVDGTHIDHIIPICLAEEGNEAELHALNSIWNLRRISAEENIAKADDIPPRELLHPNLPPLAMEIYERAVNSHQSISGGTA